MSLELTGIDEGLGIGFLGVALALSYLYGKGTYISSCVSVSYRSFLTLSP